jgi:hypothetical protein
VFTCIECRKAFSFAKGVIVAESWEQTAVRDLRKGWRREPSDEEVSEWVGAMKELLGDVEVGREYVYLDGLILSTAELRLEFEGWHSRHSLPFVPHVAAVNDREVLACVLGSRVYWLRTAVENREG